MGCVDLQHGPGNVWTYNCGTHLLSRWPVIENRENQSAAGHSSCVR